MRNRTQRT